MARSIKRESMEVIMTPDEAILAREIVGVLYVSDPDIEIGTRILVYDLNDVDGETIIAFINQEMNIDKDIK